MDPNTRALIMGAAGASGAEKLYVEDVFSTWLYTGTGATQTITNGIDLSGKGGLTWIKNRSGATGHRFTDTARGATKSLDSSSTAAEATESTGLTAFGSTGFTLGADIDYNNTGETYASWTFRKAPKFFDVVTYTGDGNASKTISHNLGSTPGFLIVKRTDSTGQWQCYHRSLTSTSYYIQLNQTSAQQTVGSQVWDVSSTNFTVYGAATNTNINGGSYVAYIFAHDAGGFGDSGNDSVVKCGSYTGNGATEGPFIDLGWEPQFLLLKAAGSTGDWVVVDNMRGLGATGGPYVYANTANSEFATLDGWRATATGFQVRSNTIVNYNGVSHIYIAIRRGPMKTPTDATKVFTAALHNGNSGLSQLIPSAGLGFPVDLLVAAGRATGQKYFVSRLTDQYSLDSTTAAAEAFGPGNPLATIAGNQNKVLIGAAGDINTASNAFSDYYFRRAPGFFDVVAYTGTGSATTVSHNLVVAPEMMIVKRRSTARSWIVYHAGMGNTQSVYLDLTLASGASSIYWNNTTPTASVFSLGTGTDANANAETYIAYLFASCPGVSKVGSYTGTGTTLQINCGFTAGARFVLIKRTDSTGDWYVWDTARGIVSGNDPYLRLNLTTSETTNTDYIDPLSSGFEISSTAPAAINASGGSFIYLAIA